MALLYAYDSVECIEALLAAGANIEAKDNVSEREGESR